MPVLMVDETFDPPIDLAQVNPNVDKLSPCLPTYDVTWLHSFVARDGTRCICVYQAPDAEAVRKAYRAAGVGFDRVWVAEPLHARL